MNQRARVGAVAEQAVADELEGRGYRILGRNVRVGHLELDVIACRGATLVFCEVRARRDGSLVAPLESIDTRKVARLRAAARGWLARTPMRWSQIRFDVAAVTVTDGAVRYVDYIAGAF